MAPENVCKEASGVIAGLRVSPTVLCQFVSHSVPAFPPPSFLFSPSLPVPFFQSAPEREGHTYTLTQHNYTYKHTSRLTLVSLPARWSVARLQVMDNVKQSSDPVLVGCQVGLHSLEPLL